MLDHFRARKCPPDREREHSDIKNLIIKKFGIKITHQKKNNTKVNWLEKERYVYDRMWFRIWCVQHKFTNLLIIF